MSPTLVVAAVGHTGSTP
jgi:hypothetical protein